MAEMTWADVDKALSLALGDNTISSYNSRVTTDVYDRRLVWWSRDGGYNGVCTVRVDTLMAALRVDYALTIDVVARRIRRRLAQRGIT